MKGFQKIMAGLDLSEMDNALLKYLGFFLGKIGPIEKLYCIHVEKDLDIHESVLDEYPELNRPTDEIITEDMEEEIRRHLDPSIQPLATFQAVEGNPLGQLLRWAHLKKVDLTALGRKQTSKKKEIIVHKLARKSGNSLLLVPEKAPEKLDSILVPVDLSDHAGLALQQAAWLSEKNNGAKIYCLKVFHVPGDYYKTGKTYEEFKEIMRGHAVKRYEKWLSGLSLEGSVKPEPIFVCDDHNNPAKIIDQQAKALDADFIVIGSKGQTTGAFILLGSTAETLIKLNDTIPMLIVKKENENFGIWDALKIV